MNQRNVLPLLTAQAFFFIGSLAFVYIVGNTLFLLSYGADRVPYVYIATGVLVSLISLGIAWLRTRYSTATTSILIYLLLMTATVFAWLGLLLRPAAWIGFLLMLLFPLAVVLVAIVLGGQAGQLFDVRRMKRNYPIVFSGGIAGFISLSLLSTWLIGLVGESVHLLPIGVGLMTVALLLFGFVLRNDGGVLRQAPAGDSSRQRISTISLFSEQFTRRLLNYQMLSAIGTQLVIYLFLVQTEARFSDEAELARFFGQFAGWRNLLNLGFTLFAGGAIIGRYGLGRSLALNPVAVAICLLLMGTVASFRLTVGGLSAASMMFWLALLTYVIDNLLSDGITATSIKTAYQAIAPQSRGPVEAVVEGIGIPIAFAITGVLILLFNLVPDLPLTAIIWFAWGITILWTLAALAAFRSYGSALTGLLQRRALAPATITLDEPDSVQAVERLLLNDDYHDVALALELLRDHADLPSHLQWLIEHRQGGIRRLALAEVERRRLAAAKQIVGALAAGPLPPAGSLQALAAIGGEEGLDVVQQHLDAEPPQVRDDALTALLTYADGDRYRAADRQLRQLGRSPRAADRCRAATIAGAVGRADFDEVLMPLLQDITIDVREQALLAAETVATGAVVPLAVANLAYYRLRSAATQALLAHEEGTGAAIAQLLSSGRDRYAGELLRLLHVCERLPAQRAIDVLAPFLDHPLATLRPQIWQLLGRRGYKPSPAWVQRRVDELTAHYQRVLLAQQTITAPEILCRALSDELTQSEHDLFLLLALQYDRTLISRAAAGLTNGVGNVQALAYESLDLTLNGDNKRLLLTICDPALSAATRLERLQGLNRIAALSEREEIEMLATMPADGRLNWLRQTARYALGRLDAANDGEQEMIETIERVAILNKIPLFAKTPSFLLTSVAAIIEERELCAGEQLIADGALDSTLYIIVDGVVRVHKGDRHILRLHSGETVGELAVLDPQPRSADVTAATDVRVFAIGKDAFDELLADYPEIAGSVIRLLAERLRREGEKIASLS